MCRASKSAASAMSVLPVPVGADQHALLGGEPGQQGSVLQGIRRVRELVKVALGQLVARENGGGHALGSWAII